MGTVDGGDEAARGSAGREERIFVSVRLRPLNEKEIERNDVCDWECISEDTVVFKNSNLPVPERSMYPTAYTFDRVFRNDCSTKQVYLEGAKEVALSVINGINSTIFAYGQTSSGKTYTMCGITGYTIADIYDHVHKHNEREYSLKFSAMEIYNESVRDLLSADPTPLRVLDDPERGTVVEKLTEETLRDWKHVMELLSICEAQRQSGETALNEASSRSHQIIRLTMESSPREFISKERSSALAASVSFVDLAGSERASQSLSAGTRLKEGCHINRSLLTLGTVIRKLSKGRNGHIPFRDSKLTRILQSSLGGNARTAVICTMSPARSHVEQSRNTLLFASCAKEVMTNAQVNVVMSEKALLKHLQKEVARLESELKSPQSNFVVSHYTGLLKAKDLEIEKLQKQVLELTMQRDLAQSQVQNLLKLGAENKEPFTKEGSNSYPHLRVRKSPDSDNFSEASPLAVPRTLDIGIRPFERSLYSYAHSESSSELSDNYIQIPNFEEDNDEASPQNVNSSSTFVRSISDRSWDDESEDQSSRASELLCREVPCIDEEETISERRSVSVRSSRDENAGPTELVVEVNEDEEENQEKEEGCAHYSPASSSPLEKPSPAEFVEGKIRCSLPSFSPRGKPSPSEFSEGNIRYSPTSYSPREKPSPSEFLEGKIRCGPTSFSPRGKPSPAEFPECSGSALSSPPTGSGSCKESFNISPCEPWFEAVESCENTPVNGFEKEFVGRPDGVQRKISELNYDDGGEPIARNGPRLSVDSSTASEVEAQKEKRTTDDNVAAASECTDVVEDKTEIDEKVETREEKQEVADRPAQGDELKPMESFKDVKNIGLDPIEDDSSTSLQDWSFEFKRLQREIILLWDACNVSLVHRTYFFLLFRGDPSDSIYMEVERRRLSFLKDTFSRGIKAVDHDQTISYSSSLKTLRREREMLCKQMQKRLSTADRQSLYLKWGVKMNSKNRRLQLASRLWTNTEDMEHIADSAFLIAKIMGMVDEPGQAPKEMFGLNFTPQQQRRRSYSLARSVISLL